MLICPKCGNTSDKIDFVPPFCINCAKERITLVCPKKIEIERCKNCERIKIRGKWSEHSEDIENYILSKCKGEFIRGVYDAENSTAIFFVKIYDKQVRVERMIDVKINTVMCTDCSRISGGYYQAIVQLRGNVARVDKYLKLLSKYLSERVSKVEELREGFDIYTTDTKETMNIIAKLSLRPIITKKLFGKSEGKNVYRTTFSIRF